MRTGRMKDGRNSSRRSCRGRSRSEEEQAPHDDADGACAGERAAASTFVTPRQNVKIHKLVSAARLLLPTYHLRATCHLLLSVSPPNVQQCSSHACSDLSIGTVQPALQNIGLSVESTRHHRPQAHFAHCYWPWGTSSSGGERHVVWYPRSHVSQRSMSSSCSVLPHTWLAG